MDHARPMAALLKINHWWILNRARSMAAKLTTLKFDVPKKKVFAIRAIVSRHKYPIVFIVHN